jgi:hypothetical protein
VRGAARGGPGGGNPVSPMDLVAGARRSRVAEPASVCPFNLTLLEWLTHCAPGKLTRPVMGCTAPKIATVVAQEVNFKSYCFGTHDTTRDHNTR